VEVYPPVDIRGGRCVQLVQGDFDRETVFFHDPVEAARHWLDQGARLGPEGAFQRLVEGLPHFAARVTALQQNGRLRSYVLWIVGTWLLLLGLTWALRGGPGARIPVVPAPDDSRLFVAGGEAGRFSAFLPGWGHMTSPVLRAIDGRPPVTGVCDDGTCAL